ncbi:hypothetical protein LV779_07760 [Streptomyces thinghirensis]|nr:hypothetical protein [Streptomyces thinghirensis]
MAASEGFTPESERVTRQLRDEIVDGARRRPGQPPGGTGAGRGRSA